MFTLKLSVLLKYAVKSINKKVKSFIIQNYASVSFILNIHVYIYRHSGANISNIDIFEAHSTLDKIYIRT